jgi:hypothetical protein
MPVFALAGLAVFGLAFRRKWLALAWTALSFGGTLFIQLLAFNRGDSEVMMEKNFVPLTFLVALPVLVMVLPHYREQLSRWKILVPALLIAAGFISIWKGRHWPVNRLAHMDTLLELAERTPGRKFYIHAQELDPMQTGPDWSYGCATMLNSAQAGPDRAINIYPCHDSTACADLSDTHRIFLLVPFFREHDHAWLNSDYFRLPTEPYRHLPLREEEERAGR